MCSHLYEDTMFSNKWDAALFLGKESALGALGGGENVVLIKSLI
jgi:hypothetical protein